MKMTWHSSACISFESSKTKVLFDPWLKSAAYLGSWQQWPPIKDSLEVCLQTKFDFIVYTHFHSDHWDPGFLREYLNIWSKRGHHPVILLAKNTWTQLAKSIGDVARDNAHITLVESGKPYSLNSNGFKITTWVSDFCDPIVCGKLLPCFSLHPSSRAIDSVSLIEDGNFSALNLNDAVASPIVNYLGKIGVRADLIMGVFAAAGSFPQCMTSLSSQEKRTEKDQFLKNARERLVKAGEIMNAKYIFPFAGQYILSGRLSELNMERAVVPVSDARNLMQELTDLKVFTLGTGESCTFLQGEIVKIGSSYVEPDSETMSAYLSEKNGIYAYELRSLEKVDLGKVLNNIEFASLKLSQMYRKMENINYSIRIKDFHSDFSWDLEFGAELRFGQFDSWQKNYSQISLDLRLLDGCLRRKSGYEGFTSMHWNQAHIGSHLSFNQSSYNSAAHYLLNFLHV